MLSFLDSDDRWLPDKLELQLAARSRQIGADIVLGFVEHFLSPDLSPEEGARLGPCVAGVGKFICIGLNYADHAAEAGMDVPTQPVLFMKATSAICGPNDDVEIPRGAEKADWEIELGGVIGRRAKAARAAGENLDLVREQYSQGTVNVTDLLDAQNQKLTADQFANTAVYEFMGDLVELQRAVAWFELEKSAEERDAFVVRILSAVTEEQP